MVNDEVSLRMIVVGVGRSVQVFEHQVASTCFAHANACSMMLARAHMQKHKFARRCENQPHCGSAPSPRIANNKYISIVLLLVIIIVVAIWFSSS